MTQTHASRVRARPAYARYKNRKRRLRRLYQAGKISYETRVEQQALARQQYLSHPGAKHQDEVKEAWIRGSYYLGRGGQLADPDSYRDGHCNEGCVGANGRDCVCQCDGINHGLASGRDLRDVTHRVLAQLRRDDPEAAIVHGVL